MVLYYTTLNILKLMSALLRAPGPRTRVRSFVRVVAAILRDEKGPRKGQQERTRKAHAEDTIAQLWEASSAVMSRGYEAWKLRYSCWEQNAGTRLHPSLA